MVKSFKIGDRVRIDSSEFPFMGLPEDLATMVFKVTEYVVSVNWGLMYEAEDSDGQLYELAESALVAA